jgi:hypothetical protein
MAGCAVTFVFECRFTLALTGRCSYGTPAAQHRILPLPSVVHSPCPLPDGSLSGTLNANEQVLALVCSSAPVSLSCDTTAAGQRHGGSASAAPRADEPKLGRMDTLLRTLRSFRERGGLDERRADPSPSRRAPAAGLGCEAEAATYGPQHKRSSWLEPPSEWTSAYTSQSRPATAQADNASR